VIELVKLIRRGDKTEALRQWKTVGKTDRKNLGLTKQSFQKEYLEELKYIRKKAMKRR